MSALLQRLRKAPEIAIFHTFKRPPYGGSNQFLLALAGELRRRGFAVGANRIGRGTRACILNAYLFDEARLRRMLHPGCRVVHRVDGPLAAYRDYDDGTDAWISELSRELADFTVFQSRYSLEGNRTRGLEFANPVVIPNAVDPRIFHRDAGTALEGPRVRLISTSWSDNPNKGARAYRWLDEHLDWSRFEYTFVGRIGERFSNIRTIGPTGSTEVARLLREHDIYVTASRYDPCSNALLEGLACGLPAIYADSGGHPELVGEAGFGFDEPEAIPGLLDRLVEEYEQRRARISIPSLAEVADRYLDAMGLAQQPRLSVDS